MVKKLVVAAVAVGALVGAGAGLASATPPPANNTVHMNSDNGESMPFACRGCYARGGSV